MKKILLLTLLLFTFCATLFSCKQQEQEQIVAQESTGLSLETSNDMTYFVVNGIGTCTDTNIILPNEYNGKPIKAIANNAFENNTGLQSVVLNKNLTSIGQYAFRNCVNLKSLTLNEELTSMQSGVFNGCSSLTEIHITTFDIMSKDVVWFPYEYDLYLNGSLVTEVGDETTPSNSCFRNCKSIKRVTISDSWIRPAKFLNCTSLTSVSIMDSVEYISDEAFRNCPALTLYDNAYYLGDDNNKYKWLIEAKNTNITSCTIHNDCQFIANKAFFHCKLKNITIPNKIAKISFMCFSGCDSLTSVTIGNGVYTIGQGAFHDCINLKNVLFSDKVTIIGDSSFKSCKSLKEVELPPYLREIDNFAFTFCKSLTKVKMKDNLKKIGKQAFAFCSSLYSIEYSGSILQWNTIKKSELWNQDVRPWDSFIYCTDGSISLLK